MALQRRNLAAWAVAGLAVISAPAMATSTWTSSSSSCWTSTNVASGCSGGSGSPTAVASAYSTTGSGSSFASASMVYYSPNGFGVTAAGESTTSPQHSMDNSGSTDAILVNFSSSVILRQLTIGWAAYDSDFTVMAYTGTTPPSLTGKTAGSLGSGWTAIGSYMNTVSNPVQNDNGGAVNATANINAGGVASSWWLISAYNSSYNATAFGGTADSTADYIKLLSIAGDNQTTTTTTVAEPGSLALVALAMGGLLWSQRRRVAGWTARQAMPALAA